ncbi:MULTISPECIES: DUF488 domain-containing protein [unclassified Nitrospina]|uniref:DUF488 domain-containing protein n=1 Tax=unclassified Nitrospina TaxID=2638683 RepID=UPI003F98A616
MHNTIFTVGHSTHEMEKFVRLLKMYDITAICDVRSSPYSHYNPQYNREKLKASLLENGIKYVFLGKELGARSDDPTCYKDGKVQYDCLAKTELFKIGIERLLKGARDYNIALVCAEKDPLECHRTILVARELEKKGLSIFHILGNGEIETHDEAMARLIKGLNSGHAHDLFISEEDIRNQAYSRQAEKISYTLPDDGDESPPTNMKAAK